MIKNYEFSIKDNIKYLFILFLSFNFALSLVIFFGITKMNLNKISKKN